jgi:hypothetical protein
LILIPAVLPTAACALIIRNGAAGASAGVRVDDGGMEG